MTTITQEKLSSLIAEMMTARKSWTEWDNNPSDAKFDDFDEEASARFDDGYSSGIYTALQDLGLLTDEEVRRYVGI